MSKIKKKKKKKKKKLFGNVYKSDLLLQQIKIKTSKMKIKS